MKLIELRTRQNGEKVIKAFADIEHQGIIIRDFRIIQEPGRRPWVTSPQSSWRDPIDGMIKYKQIVTLPSPLKTEADALILSAWFGMQEKQNEGNNIQR